MVTTRKKVWEMGGGPLERCGEGTWGVGARIPLRYTWTNMRGAAWGERQEV